MQSKNDNIEFMIYDKVGEVDEVTEEFLQYYFLGIKSDWKHQ